MDLHGHTSSETAYVVDDYPYGFKKRCRIRFWLERANNRGWRFCSQTEHPRKKTWNAPKKGTYYTTAAAMYLENGKVKCDALSTFCSATDAAAFVERHPEADLTALKEWASMKVIMLSKFVSGEGAFTINGTPVTRGEAQLEHDRAELVVWRKIVGV